MFVENPKPYHHKIRSGMQVKIDGSDFELEQIIKQHTIYGIQQAEKVGKGFSGVAYRYGKPISVGAIEAGIEQRDQEMIDRALEARKNTAAATDAVMNKRAQEFGSRQTAPLEIEIVEESRGPTDNGSKFNETIQVVKDSQAEYSPKKKGRPRKA
jgi:hypothetical protein